VTGCKDGSVRMWEVRTGALIQELLAVREGITPFTAGQVGSYHGIEALTITPDNRYVAAAGDDFVFGVWEISTGRMAASFRTDAKVRKCAASPRGHRFVAGDMSGRVHFLDFPKGG
jgi:WD40 repeat protein